MLKSCQILVGLTGDFVLMAQKKKKHRQLIKLGNSESKHIYFTYKNKNNTIEKLALKKYAPDLRKIVVFTEMK